MQAVFDFVDDNTLLGMDVLNVSLHQQVVSIFDHVLVSGLVH